MQELRRNNTVNIRHRMMPILPSSLPPASRPSSSSFPSSSSSSSSSANPLPASATHRRHLLFSIASSALSWPHHKPYVRLWYDNESTFAFVFLDRSKPQSDPDPSLPGDRLRGHLQVPLHLPRRCPIADPYTFRGGLRSAIRVALVVKEAVDRGEPGLRWFVFGDDDTVFFVDNLVRTLSKYDHERWFYVGANSESYNQNARYLFDMAFGGGGFAISSSLARALAKVFDSCLVRYAHLYGSSAELGVGLLLRGGARRGG